MPPRRILPGPGALVATLVLLALLHPSRAAAEDGYELWLRYRPVSDAARLASYRAAITEIVFAAGSPTLEAARVELQRGLQGLLDRDVALSSEVTRHGALVVGVPETSPVADSPEIQADLSKVGDGGFAIRSLSIGGRRATVVASTSEVGVLHGVFRFLRLLQTQEDLEDLALLETPAVQLRLLDHWDNLDRTVERGYAGFSLWDWHKLPDYLDPRYTDYARANASVGINGTVLTNVNANATALTPEYVRKAAALADVFRPWGIRVYLTARFSAPLEIGGLETADPLAPEVAAWWRAKADEIYRAIPDFGGFLVKANSEGQPGPQDYGRSHAEGANVLADAVAPHGGVVMWRAFVYSSEEPDDRAKQAFNEFTPLDGAFSTLRARPGQERPHRLPASGALPPPLRGHAEDAADDGGPDQPGVPGPRHPPGLPGPVVGRGAPLRHLRPGSGVAGVASRGRHPARLSADGDGRRRQHRHRPQLVRVGDGLRQLVRLRSPGLGPRPRLRHDRRRVAADDLHRRAGLRGAGEGDDARLPGSGRRLPDPPGLHHLMARGHHYGPGPWVSGGPRADWTSVYYHRADAEGIGFDRTATGSNAVAQYFPPLPERWGRLETVPEKYLLWFHHVPWDHRMASGRTLWEELLFRYQRGVDTVRGMQDTWRGVEGLVDPERHAQVSAFLAIQEQEARWWRDASVLYFQTFSGRPLPDGYEQPEHTLEHYMAIEKRFVPGI